MWCLPLWGRRPASYRHEADKSDNRTYRAPTDKPDDCKIDITTLQAGEEALSLSEKRGASAEALTLHRGFLALAKAPTTPPL